MSAMMGWNDKPVSSDSLPGVSRRARQEQLEHVLDQLHALTEQITQARQEVHRLAQVECERPLTPGETQRFLRLQRVTTNYRSELRVLLREFWKVRGLADL